MALPQPRADVVGGCVAERRDGDTFEIAVRRGADGPLYVRNARWRHAERANPQADERKRGLGVSGHLTAHRERDPGPVRGLDREPHELQKSGMQRVTVALERGVPAVRGERVLEKVVRAQAYEADVAGVGVRREDR